MIRLIDTKFKNFFSYGNAFTTFSFQNNETYLIMGANGAGKSTIIESLVYACYGKPLSGMKEDKLINNINGSDLEVILRFEKDGQFYKIHRGRKPNFVKFFVYDSENFDNEKEISLDDISNTNKKIVEILNISYELFIRIVIFSANHTPFFELAPRSGSVNQSLLIEELFQLLELADNATVLKDITKENENRLKVEKAKLEQQEENISKLEDQQKRTKERLVQWHQTHKSKIKSMEDKMEELNNLDVDLEKEKENHEKLEVIKKHFDDVVSLISQYDHDIKHKNKKVDELSNDLISLKDSTCPYCKQSYIPDPEAITKLESEIDIITTDINELSEKIKDKSKESTKLEKALEKMSKSLKIMNYNEVVNIINELNTIESNIELVKSEQNPYIEQYEEISKMSSESIDYTNVNEITKELEHQKFLYKLLTNKNSFVRKSLFNKHIPYLNERLNTYLQYMELPYVVTFSHDLSANIKKMGKVLEFGNLSNGQKARVNIALSLAFRDMLQSIHGQINICILDEVLDKGLDPIGVEAAVKMLRRKSLDDKVAIYVITHRTEIDNIFENVINVQMVNNFSVIK